MMVFHIFCFQRLLNTPVQSPLYRWVKLCRRSLRIWIPIHIEFHWASAQESHRMLLIMMWLDLSNLNTKFLSTVGKDVEKFLQMERMIVLGNIKSHSVLVEKCSSNYLSQASLWLTSWVIVCFQV